LVPVDGDDSTKSARDAPGVDRHANRATQPYQQLPTSLELLRQLEACVREILEISLLDR
jgi:hypothetical protein